MALNRRQFGKWAGVALAAAAGSAGAACSHPSPGGPPGGKADYTLRIGSGKAELAPDRSCRP